MYHTVCDVKYCSARGRDRVEEAIRPCDVRDGIAGCVLLGDIPLDTRGPTGRDDAGDVQDPLPDRKVARHSTGRPVLHVEESDSPAARREYLRRVAAPDRGPVDVELEVDRGRELSEQDLPDRRPLERLELEGVVVVAERDPAIRQPRGELTQIRREAPHAVRRPTFVLGQPRDDDSVAAQRNMSIGHVRGPGPEAIDSDVSRHRPEPGLGQQAPEVRGRDVEQARELDEPVPGLRHRPQSTGQVPRHEVADRVELERDLVSLHRATIATSRPSRTAAAAGGNRSRSLFAMTPLGIGIVGTGNIAGGYARDALTHPEIRLVAVTDLDNARAAAFATEHACRVHASLDDLLADDEVDIVVNLTVHHAHYDVTRSALEAGRHVYSEKPLALRSIDAADLVELAQAHDLRLGCSPSTFLGEAQQTAAAAIRAGRLGTVRAIYADVSWGRIELWHPAPAPFYDVGPLVDVGVYPLTLVTTMLGPARSVRAWGWEVMPDRRTLDGGRFRIGSPDLGVAAVELATGAVLRLTTSFYVGRPAGGRGGIEFHGDDASLALGSFQAFDATVEIGPFDGNYAPVELVRPGYHGTAWARGVAEMAAAIGEGRPHRASAELAAHVVDIIEAAGRSIADGGRPVAVTSTFEPPDLMPWAAAPAASAGVEG